jgi:hypothetical protein
MVLMSTSGSRRTARIPLDLDDSLFGVEVEPLQVDDPTQVRPLPKFDVTPGGMFRVGNLQAETNWQFRIIAVSTQSARILASPSCGYDEKLVSFCDAFLAPPSIPPSRRQYDKSSVADMAQLSIRFLGAGTDRLRHTIGISKGLSRVPALNFPQGRWKSGKTPKVSKGKIGHLKYAGIGEVVFTDTFESGDSKYHYGQAFVDLVSQYGDVIPLKSRNDVGQSVTDFCSRNWVPLFLVRDNIGENVGGSIMDECCERNIKNCFICPHHPQQNLAEGYLGRVTTTHGFFWNGPLGSTTFYVDLCCQDLCFC